MLKDLKATRGRERGKEKRTGMGRARLEKGRVGRKKKPSIDPKRAGVG